MVGRVREFDIDQVTVVAMELFWSQGYEATSLQELILATSLSKSSFYQAFGSKHELFQRCLSLYEQNLVAGLKRMLEQAPNGLAFVQQVLLGVANETQGPNSRRGCLMMNTASEFSQSDQEVARLIKRGRKRMLAVFELAFDRAQSDGSIAQATEPEILAEYLLTCVSGLKTQVKAGNSAISITRIARFIIASLAHR